MNEVKHVKALDGHTRRYYNMNGIDFMMSLICIDIPNYLWCRTFNQQDRDIIMYIFVI